MPSNQHPCPQQIAIHPMLTSIRSISRFFGGKGVFLDVLRPFANAGEGNPHCGLQEALTRSNDLEVIFAQISEGGPYAEPKKTPSPDRIKFTYGTCYGGTCGMGTTHTYERKSDGWKLIPGEIEICIH